MLGGLCCCIRVGLLCLGPCRPGPCAWGIGCPGWSGRWLGSLARCTLSSLFLGVSVAAVFLVTTEKSGPDRWVSAPAVVTGVHQRGLVSCARRMVARSSALHWWQCLPRFGSSQLSASQRAWHTPSQWRHSKVALSRISYMGAPQPQNFLRIVCPVHDLGEVFPVHSDLFAGSTVDDSAVEVC